MRLKIERQNKIIKYSQK